MTTITSPHNPRLKELRKLVRRRERERSGRFLAEGEDLVAAATAAGRPAIAGYRAAGTAIGGDGFEDVEQSVMASLSTLGSGTRAIGVYEQCFTKPVGPLCVYLHGVGDPGNVGAVLRSALAFGASCVALGPGCADPHSPKAVRASMGAIFALELARVGDVDELPGTRVALVAGAGEPIWDVRPTQALTLLVGAEREGLPDDVVEACERVAHIPISSESLNAAMAATVALYEMTRGGRDNDDRVPSS
ncbi:MAG TPA: RNA methyltransferase [Solirubrobacteraceae bacterium]|jgi:TrmH family RNA methyltransferase|nr:RNA methyltransferase [Solirubrobacteraceae bacterium]